MPRFRFRTTLVIVASLAALTALLAVTTSSPAKPRSPARALATIRRTFVSTSGSDANPCDRATPCRSFGAAIANTTAGGEVIVLDSGGYGPVTITKAVSIIAPPGIYAGITALSGDAIDVSAGTSDKVTLRGLTLNGIGGNI